VEGRGHSVISVEDVCQYLSQLKIKKKNCERYCEIII
jgi:hypothetical protein